MFLIMIIIIGALLFVAGIADIKSKKISRKNILALLILCILGAFFKKDFNVFDALGGLATGLCILGVSIISKDQLGRGDGFVIAALGIVLGFRECLCAVCTASLIMTIVSVILLALKKADKNTRLAFIPALFVGYATCAARLFSL